MLPGLLTLGFHISSYSIVRYPTSNDLRIDYHSLPKMFILSSMSPLHVGHNIIEGELIHMGLMCLADNMRWNIDFAKHLLNVK